MNAQLNNAYSEIENWCSKWRRAVNGSNSKTETILLNSSLTAIKVPTVKSESWAVTQQTKPLGLTIDDRLEYKRHARSAITKEMGNRNQFRSKCSRRWGLPLQTQALLFRTVIKPMRYLFYRYGGQRNKKDIQIFQNKVIRFILQNCLSTSIQAAECLLGIPPMDFFGESLNNNFLTKTRQNSPNLIYTANDEGLQLQSSTSHILQNDLERYQKQMAPNGDPLQYTAKSIPDFVNSELTNRCKSLYVLEFLKNLPRFVPEIETTNPPRKSIQNKQDCWTFGWKLLGIQGD